MDIFNNYTIDGSSAEEIHTGGKLALWVWGNLDGGNVVLELKSPDGTAWVQADNGDWASSLVKVMDMPPCAFRLTIVGAGAGASIYAQASGF